MDWEIEQKSHTGTSEKWGEVWWAFFDLIQELGILQIQLLRLEVRFTELLNILKNCY